MFKNKYYVILGVLVLITISIQVAFSQVKKEETRFSEEKYRVIKELKDKENDSAIKLAEGYLVSNPNDIDIVNLLVERYITKKDLSKAEVALKKGIVVKPNNPWTRRLLAQVYRLESQQDPTLKSDNLALALEQVKIGLGSNPNDVGLLIEATRIYSLQGDNIRAIEAIDLAITINPNDTTLKSEKENIATSPKWGKEKIKK